MANKRQVPLCSIKAYFQKVHLSLFLIVFLLPLCTTTISAFPDSKYGNKYKVLRLHARSENDVKVIHDLQHSHQLDPWRQIWRGTDIGDYMVSPEHADSFQKQLQDNNIRHHVIVDDAERFVHENAPQRRQVRLRRSTSVHEYRHKFLSYQELKNFLKLVKNTATNADIELGSIGKSYEGRPTPYVKITSKGSNSPKDAIFIDAGVHSREWISPAMTVEIIQRLAFNQENDRAVDDLLKEFEWIIVPIVNPDGYAYTFRPGMQHRLWRKSRSTLYSEDPHCYGVDLNRNFGFAWNNTPIHGGSSNPCSGTFSGPSSFSEPESQNLRDLLLQYKDQIKAYLSFHSFGQFFLYPWGYSTDVQIDDEPDLHQLASAFANTMEQKNYVYHVGGSAKVLYPAAGASDDYVRGTVEVKYAYTVELPPHESSRYGFLLPEANVNTVVSDTWTGLKAFAHRLAQLLDKDRNGSAETPNVEASTHNNNNVSSHPAEGVDSETVALPPPSSAITGFYPQLGFQRVVVRKRDPESSQVIRLITVPVRSVAIRRPRRSARFMARKRTNKIEDVKT